MYRFVLLYFISCLKSVACDNFLFFFYRSLVVVRNSFLLVCDLSLQHSCNNVKYRTVVLASKKVVGSCNSLIIKSRDHSIHEDIVFLLVLNSFLNRGESNKNKLPYFCTGVKRCLYADILSSKQAESREVLFCV